MKLESAIYFGIKGLAIGFAIVIALAAIFSFIVAASIA